MKTKKEETLDRHTNRERSMKLLAETKKMEKGKTPVRIDNRTIILVKPDKITGPGKKEIMNEVKRKFNEKLESTRNRIRD